jgi:hypothetical protein
MTAGIAFAYTAGLPYEHLHDRRSIDVQRIDRSNE